MVCTFFGHRDTTDLIKDRLKQTIIKVIEENQADTFYIGNHGNFDRLVFSVLEELKEAYPKISVNVVLSYLPKNDGGDYSNTVLPEDIEKVPKRFAINFRSKWMIEQSDMVIVYAKHSFSCTKKIVDMAKRKNKTVINIAE